MDGHSASDTDPATPGPTGAGAPTAAATSGLTRRLHAPLKHSRQSPGLARRITASALASWGVDEDTIATALLVVSELVTNAVEHAQPSIVLHLSCERARQRLRVQVADGGPASSEGSWTSSCAPDEHGRGLSIISCVANAHGAYTRTSGTIHWATLTYGACGS
ncbi:ATP-binding protein [Streptomyces zhihengii]|uniref:ATP-binding protein n=1 Tax=Streptomyces zhihengii TaxID=1818004 RepID=A0ABS2V6X6_9ACTN|nr:ATP-binding protein [Streptomyces zhihengii]MBM9624570.1 ATP-binding protein [Streptomyces zhihengii]